MPPEFTLNLLSRLVVYFSPGNSSKTSIYHSHTGDTGEKITPPPGLGFELGSSIPQRATHTTQMVALEKYWRCVAVHASLEVWTFAIVEKISLESCPRVCRVMRACGTVFLFVVVGFQEVRVHFDAVTKLHRWSGLFMPIASYGLYRSMSYTCPIRTGVTSRQFCPFCVFFFFLVSVYPWYVLYAPLCQGI